MRLSKYDDDDTSTLYFSSIIGNAWFLGGFDDGTMRPLVWELRACDEQVRYLL